MVAGTVGLGLGLAVGDGLGVGDGDAVGVAMAGAGEALGEAVGTADVHATSMLNTAIRAIERVWCITSRTIRTRRIRFGSDEV